MTDMLGVAVGGGQRQLGEPMALSRAWGALTGGLSRAKAHRAYSDAEAKFLRIVSRAGNGNLPHGSNPGLRVEDAFVDAEEEKTIVAAAREMTRLYGISHITPEQKAFLAGQMKHLKGLPEDGSYVNMMRVTGRFESEEQQLAPWGHGPSFTIDKVPAALRLVMERIQKSPHFHLGAPTDITINYRHSTFYRLDPHVDPEKDGGNIFILGLLSPTVLSMSPCLPSMHPQQYLHMDQRKVSEQGWMPGKDIDALLPSRGLLHLSGDARYKWNHGIRVGVSRAQLEAYGVEVKDEGPEGAATQAEVEGDVKSLCLYDWFGSIRHPVPRGRERLSIIFAFNDPN